MAPKTRVLFVLVVVACCYVVSPEKIWKGENQESATASKLADDKKSQLDTPNVADDKQSDALKAADDSVDGNEDAVQKDDNRSDLQTDTPKEADNSVDAGDKGGSEVDKDSDDKRSDRQTDAPKEADDSVDAGDKEDRGNQKIPFPELEEMDIVDENWTPGNVTLDDLPSLWPGQMKPFGSIGKSFRIKQSIGFPLPHTFYHDYTKSYTPLHMKGAIAKFDFYKNWQSDKYFLQQPPGYYVPGHRGTGEDADELSFHDTVAKYKIEKFQFFSAVPTFLRQETMMPECLLCEPFLEQMMNHMIHLASVNDDSNVMITENLDVVVCVVRGVAELMLLSKIEYPHMINPSMMKFLHSRQNEFGIFKTMRTAVYHKARVESGDCLYIPAKWYRYLLMYANPEMLILSFSWNHDLTTEFQSQNCADFSSNATVLTHKFRDVDTYDDESDEAALEYFARYLSEKKKLTINEFLEKVKSDERLMRYMEKWTREYDTIARELFDNLNLNKDSYFSLTDLKKVTGEVRGHLAGQVSDRVADLEDIMTDEYDDDNEEPELPEGIQEYIVRYVDKLKNVVMSGLEELLLTGELPDLEKKLAEYDDTPRKLHADNNQENVTPKPEADSNQEHATPKPEADDNQEKTPKEPETPVAGDKGRDKVDSGAEFPELDDSYIVVDNDEEEEIAMDEDDESDAVQKRQKEAAKTDTAKPGKATSSIKDKTKPGKETSSIKDKAKTEKETSKKDKTKPDKSKTETESNKGDKNDKSDKIRNKDEL